MWGSKKAKAQPKPAATPGDAKKRDRTSFGVGQDALQNFVKFQKDQNERVQKLQRGEAVPLTDTTDDDDLENELAELMGDDSIVADENIGVDEDLAVDGELDELLSMVDDHISDDDEMTPGDGGPGSQNNDALSGSTQNPRDGDESDMSDGEMERLMNRKSMVTPKKKRPAPTSTAPQQVRVAPKAPLSTESHKDVAAAPAQAPAPALPSRSNQGSREQIESLFKSHLKQLLTQSPAPSYLVVKDSLTQRFGVDVYSRYEKEVKGTIEKLFGLPPPIPEEHMKATKNTAVSANAPQQAPQVSTPMTLKKEVLAKYKTAAKELDASGRRDEALYCMKVYKELQKVPAEQITKETLPALPDINRPESDATRTKLLDDMLTMIQKQVLGFQKLRAKLNPNDNQSKLCDVEMRNLGALKDAIIASKITGGPPPRYSQEIRQFVIHRSFPELGSSDLSIEVMKCSDIPCPKNTKMAVSIAYSLLHPDSDNPQAGSTDVVEGSFSPVYEGHKEKFNISRRRFLRFCQGRRGEILFKILFHKAGGLLGFSTKIIHMADARLKLSAFESTCELEERLHLTVPDTPRKKLGGQLHVRVRIREPLSGDANDRVTVDLPVATLDSIQKVQDLNTLKIRNVQTATGAVLRTVSAILTQVPCQKIYSAAVLKLEKDTIVNKLSPYIKAKKRPFPADIEQLRQRHKQVSVELQNRNAKRTKDEKQYYLGLGVEIRKFRDKITEFKTATNIPKTIVTNVENMLQIMLEEVEPYRTKYGVDLSAPSAPTPRNVTPAVANESPVPPQRVSEDKDPFLRPSNIKSMDVLDFEVQKCVRILQPHLQEMLVGNWSTRAPIALRQCDKRRKALQKMHDKQIAVFQSGEDPNAMKNYFLGLVLFQKNVQTLLNAIQKSDSARFTRLEPWVEILSTEVETIRPHAEVTQEEEQEVLRTGKLPMEGTVIEAESSKAEPTSSNGNTSTASPVMAGSSPTITKPAHQEPSKPPEGADTAALATKLLTPANIRFMDILEYEQRLCVEILKPYMEGMLNMKGLPANMKQVNERRKVLKKNYDELGTRLQSDPTELKKYFLGLLEGRITISENLTTLRSTNSKLFTRLEPWIRIMTNEIDTIRPHAGVSQEEEAKVAGTLV